MKYTYLAAVLIAVFSLNGYAKNTENILNTHLEIIVNNRNFQAILYDNETARTFVKLLPLKLTMQDLHANEKYFHFSKNLLANPFYYKKIHKGDLMLWQTQSLVLFYKTFATSYAYTKIGRIKNPQGLEDAVGAKEVVVEFKIIQ